VLEAELRAIADRYERLIVIEGNDGQYATVIERILFRQVHRVPLLGGRMSSEAVREGLEEIGLLPRELAGAGAAS
jgi:hypothetical protein